MLPVLSRGREAEMEELIAKIEGNLSRVILGKPEAIRFLVVAILSGGHVLLEDVPGVGKTTMAKALAKTISGTFKRVQFTPDLLPSDILGTSIFNPEKKSFHFRPGPVFGNILLADEINRASPRTQSSLLEAMSEQQVTLDGKRHDLPRPFLVIATQNPIEYHGTYPLPEAQLDRFMLQLSLGYPQAHEEVTMLFDQKIKHPLEDLEPKLTTEDLSGMQEQVKRVEVSQEVARYIVDLVAATRTHEKIKMGVSPRGSQSLYRAAQAAGYINGRDFVLPDDAKTFAVPILAHRIVLETKAKFGGVSKADVIDELVNTVPVPA